LHVRKQLSAGQSLLLCEFSRKKENLSLSGTAHRFLFSLFLTESSMRTFHLESKLLG
jgi:hypothetical protein